MSETAGTVDFGFADVNARDKAAMVGEVFSDVAPYYDRMNDVMSLGMHRWWKTMAAWLLDVKPGMRVLDLAAGSGDIAKRLEPYAGDGGKVVLGDINAEMLALGKRRMPEVAAARCDAEHLPFAARSFQRLMIAFGLRNITDRQAALDEMYRVLTVGGKAGILEFSPDAVCPSLHRRYLTGVLPLLGRVIADDEKSYLYLGESILRFPDPQGLAAMLAQSGFERIRCFKFAGGAVAFHTARRLS